MRVLVLPRWRTAFLVAACLALVFAWSGRVRATSPNVVISQVYGGGGNSGATLTNDFVELYNSGTTAVDLSGWSVQYASSSGTTWQVTGLSGILQPGQFYLVQEAVGAGGTTALPAPDAAGTIPMSATAGKVALVARTSALTGSCPTGVVDLVGYGGANCSELGPTAALSNTTAAQRIAEGCVDTDNNAGDFAVTFPSPRNTASPLGKCGLPTIPTSIHDIQGAGNTSAFAGQLVKTEGIVTGVKYNGFFIQAPDAEADADPNTSEGVFVFTSSTPPTAAAVRTRVQVIGLVTEYGGDGDLDGVSMTELSWPAVKSMAADQALPAAVELGAGELNPHAGSFALEKYEGMRVHLDEVISVSPTGGSLDEAKAVSTSDGLFFAVLPGVGRPFREPGIDVALPLPAEAPSPTMIPRFDGNPERIGIDTFSVFLTPAAAKVRTPPAGTLDVTTGVTVSDITGPLEYAYRSYIVDAEGWNLPTAVTANRAVQPVRPAMPGEFTVATINLARFFDTTDDPGTLDVALTAAAFEIRLKKASMAIRQVMQAPDIIGVEEVENLETLQALAERIGNDALATGQPLHYSAYLQEGHDIGGIDVGFLVKDDRVTVQGMEPIGFGTKFEEPDGRLSDLNDRPSLVLHAQVQNAPAAAYEIAVVVNHLKALSGVEDANGRVRAKRLAQAKELAAALQALQASGAHVVSVGDYNAFDVNDGYVDVMGLVKGTEADAERVTLWAPSPVTPPLFDLIDLAPADQRYSFVFDGNAQELDHVLASSNVVPTGIGYARMNADFPESLHGDASRPERLSDHDPVVGYFRLDTSAPVVQALAPSPAVLWAPNHAMTPISIGVTASDDFDASPACRITGVAGNDGAGDNDWRVTGALTLDLRAERLGNGNGRTYRIGVACTDASGNASAPAYTTVFVPHDQRRQ